MPVIAVIHGILIKHRELDTLRASKHCDIYAYKRMIFNTFGGEGT